MLKFQTHGIKTSKGLERCSYSVSTLINDKKCITIYGKNYKSFSSEIRAAFTVENNTEIMTDYFEDDMIRVYPEHPLFKQVAEAAMKQTTYRFKRKKSEYYIKRIEEINSMMAG